MKIQEDGFPSIRLPVFNNEPGDEVGLLADLFLHIRQDDAPPGLEAGGGAFAEGGGQRSFAGILGEIPEVKIHFPIPLIV